MTYTDLLEQLTSAGSAAPSHEAAELARVICGVSREWCLINKDVLLPDAASLSDALERRKNGTPLQYILGEAWFCGNRFTVSEDCLIPQPDTEHLVYQTLNHISSGSKLADLCTGSGCIAISLLLERSDISAVAVDISPTALNIAEHNAAMHGVLDRVKFIHCDVFSDEILPLISDADIIVSNPPYINTDVIPTLSQEVQHEPALALDGGSDGMIFYRRFILQLAKQLKPGCVMLLEIGYDQHERIDELCREAGLSCKFHRDFGGNIRVCEIMRIK